MREIASGESFRALCVSLWVVLTNLCVRPFTSRYRMVAVGRCFGSEIPPGTLLTFDRARRPKDGDIVGLEVNDPERGRVLLTKQLRWARGEWYAVSRVEGLVPARFGRVCATLIGMSRRPRNDLFEHLADREAADPASVAWSLSKFADAHRYIERHPPDPARVYAVPP